MSPTRNRRDRYLAADTLEPVAQAARVGKRLSRRPSSRPIGALGLRRQERAFEAIVERYRKPILRYCRRFLPEARAEDALQQAFLNAWSAIRSGVEVADLRHWLYRIARNAAFDAANKAGYDYDELTE